ncbi:hypothetical protein IWW50_006324, partial [Coemansia erecta]
LSSVATPAAKPSESTPPAEEIQQVAIAPEPESTNALAADSEATNALVADSEPKDASFAADSGSKVDMDDALAKARAIAAKLGSMQRPSTTSEELPPKEPAGNLGNEPHRDDDSRDERRSASPNHHHHHHHRLSKRSRSPDRSSRREGRRRFDDTDLRPMLSFPVPTQLSGLIIGRNGNNLRALEQQHGVRIQFDSNADKRDPERQITIEGPVAGAESARREILEFIDRHASEQKRPGNNTGQGQGQGQGGGGGMTIVVPGSKVGLIIGRGGESIREIQFSSGASVQVQPDNGRMEREIVLAGTGEQIERARARIMDIVAMEGPREQRGGGGGFNQQQQQQHHQSRAQGHMEEFQVPAESVGIIIGRGGETIKFLQQDTGTRIQVLQGPQFSGPMRPVTISGDYSACMRARGMIEEKIEGAQ